MTWDGALREALQALAQREGATLFMTLLAAFTVLLSRYSGQTDVVVGTPVANRPRPELEGLIGFFVNTLALRTDLSGEPSFVEVLRRVKETCLGGFAHQELPFERLVEELQPERDVRYHPVYQVMFVLQNAPVAAIDLPGVQLVPLPMASETAKFDLTLSVEESGDGLAATLEYSTELFEPALAERMLDHLQVLLREIVAAPERAVTRYRLMTAAERALVVETWNTPGERGTDAAGPRAGGGTGGETSRRRGGRARRDARDLRRAERAREPAGALPARPRAWGPTCWWRSRSTARSTWWWRCWPCGRRAAPTCRWTRATRRPASRRCCGLRRPRCW